MTAQELINAAEKRGLRYEINTLIEVEGTPHKLSEIGINYKGWIWAWFTFHGTTEAYAIFRNAYNQMTGAEDKSRRRGSSIKNQLSK